MSLIRQLWLAVIASTILAFTGSFLLSMLTARHYLEDQLAVKNSDNAASLALSMSQLPKDKVTVELQVAALFDSGQYETIRLVEPNGQVMLERISPSNDLGAPPWFVSLMGIHSRPGTAQISNGWNQFATIHLVSHTRPAYQELWQGGLKLLAWFGFGGVAIGFLGTLLVGALRKPLDAVVHQAEAISERRFTRIAEPRTPELKSMARAMNAMVERLKSMFAEEAARLEQVRREANQDSLTGLANRAHFMNTLQNALSSDDAPPSGVLLLLRIADLGGINHRAGREMTDELLRRTGQLLTHVVTAHAATHLGAHAARLNGADFALLAPGLESGRALAETLLAGMGDLAAVGLVDGERIAHIAHGCYRHDDELASALARVDTALAQAENQSDTCIAEACLGPHIQATSAADWRHLLEGAINSQRLRLIEFPVSATTGGLLHLECPLRLQTMENGDWLVAGSFMPMASRLKMTAALDLAVVRMALARIQAGAAAVAVNLSGESVQETDFRKQLQAMLTAQPTLATGLWLEVSEIGAFQHFDAFRELCRSVQPLGCRIGIEHFGHRFSEIGHLHDLGMDYLKVDGSFIRGIDQQQGNQAFLKGLCSIAHNIGLTVIAENVQTPEELAALPALGFDGATGPAVKAGE